MQGEDVELGSLALPDRPEGAGALPGVVLIHDVWGLGDHPRELASRLAREGFAVLALDLYRREAKVEIRDPGAWMRELSDPQVLSDLESGVRLLEAHDACSGRVGVIGFCMGGSYALLGACGTRGVRCSVPFYGLLSHDHGLLHSQAGLDPSKKPRAPLDAARELSCPLLAFFGADDEYVPVEDVRELERRVAASGQPAEVVLCEGAGHAFMNDTRPDAYRPEIAAQAWRRAVAFLREHLQPR